MFNQKYKWENSFYSQKNSQELQRFLGSMSKLVKFKFEITRKDNILKSISRYHILLYFPYGQPINHTFKWDFYLTYQKFSDLFFPNSSPWIHEIFHSGKYFFRCCRLISKTFLKNFVNFLGWCSGWSPKFFPRNLTIYAN